MPTSRKPTSRKRHKSRFTLGPELQRDIAGAILVILALLTSVTLFFPGGDIGRVWSGLVTRLFGWGSLVIAIALGAGGIIILRQGSDRPVGIKPQQAAGLAVLGVLMLGALHLLANAGRPGLAVAEAGEGGGWVGYMASQALVSSVGTIGAAIVMAGLAAAATLLSLDVGPSELRAGYLTLRRRVQDYYNLHFRPVPSSTAATPASVQPPVPKQEPARTREPAAQSPQPAHAPISTISAQPPKSPPETLPVRREWRLPSLDLLEVTDTLDIPQVDIRRRVKTIEDTLLSFNVSARVVEVNQGPAVTQFGVQPAPGVTVNRIVARQNDLALALAASPIRVEAPVPGKSVVGIEVPNAVTAVVGLRGVIETTAFQRMKARSRLAFALGQDVSGGAVCADLAKMPHLLIAGATGSGKTVCLNSTIACLLLNAMPDEIKFLMVDPKMVELAGYNGVPHLIAPVVTDVSKVVNVLKWCTREMQRRYKLFSGSGARNIDAYNRLPAAKRGSETLPFIIVIIDELADVMMMAPEQTEPLICRLAQMARATGIHLIIATQRPSVDVITGLIKANFPARISFAVTSQVDSRVVLDMAGAEKLLGRGDMLYMPSDSSRTVRLQGTWVSDDELEQIVAFWKDQAVGMAPTVTDLDAPDSAGQALAPWSDDDQDRDEMFDEAIEVVREAGSASASLLQRKLRIGYARASRLIDQLEDQGIIGGPAGGGRPREVLDIGIPAALDDQ